MRSTRPSSSTARQRCSTPAEPVDAISRDDGNRADFEILPGEVFEVLEGSRATRTRWNRSLAARTMNREDDSHRSTVLRCPGRTGPAPVPRRHACALYRKLGCHLGDGLARFAVWAPNAEAVSVIGDFNGWDADAHPLAARGRRLGHLGGVRSPACGHGQQLQVRDPSPRSGERVDKADPFARRAEMPPRPRSIVWNLDVRVGRRRVDGQPRAARNALGRADVDLRGAPRLVARVRRGRRACSTTASWRRCWPSTCTRLGFTHVELLPIMEHPFYGSWGYQTTGYFAPTSRYGTPQDFMYLVDYLHQRGIGVILDWVPSHFPTDEHGLALLRRHAPLRARRPAPGLPPRLEQRRSSTTAATRCARSCCRSALFWLDQYHVDGLRVDAVASMLYLDYSRKAGEWIPNQLRRPREPRGDRRSCASSTRRSTATIPDVQTIAEESTAWPMVSRPTYVGGLGFG